MCLLDYCYTSAHATDVHCSLTAVPDLDLGYSDMCLTGRHKAGLMGQVLAPSSTLKEMEKQ
jgi:hypothetical protein